MAQFTTSPRAPKSVAIALMLPVVFFFAINLALGLSQFIGMDDSTNLAKTLRFFDLDAEQTVPAWYSTILLALAAFTTALVALSKQANRQPFTKHWFVLAAIFLLLSMDEALAIHERSILPLRNLFDLGGLLRFSWVIPAAVFVAIVGAAYFRFLLAMPPRLRHNIVGAAIIYIGGALILEMVGGFLFDSYGAGVFTALTAITEEIAEMVGIIWYIHTLADHISAPQPIGVEATPPIGAFKAQLLQ